MRAATCQLALGVVQEHGKLRAGQRRLGGHLNCLSLCTGPFCQLERPATPSVIFGNSIIPTSNPTRTELSRMTAAKVMSTAVLLKTCSKQFHDLLQVSATWA